MCPATTLLVAEDIKYRCERSGASIFVGDAVSVEKFLRVRKQCPQVRVVLQVDGGDQSGVLDLEKELAAVPENAVYQGSKPDVRAPAIIYFTSGRCWNRAIGWRSRGGTTGLGPDLTECLSTTFNSQPL